MGASANSIGFPAGDGNRCYAPPPPPAGGKPKKSETRCTVWAQDGEQEVTSDLSDRGQQICIVR